jgi:hypothetical protein
VFQPPQARSHKVPALYYLAGLTCTEETFAIKSGAQRVAAELGLMLVSPDTSPRGANIPGEAEAWDFGVGAGFYVDATYGGGGTTGEPQGGIIAGVPHTTPGGHVYTTQINLSVLQTAVIDYILEYGKVHGYSNAEIDVAVADAFYESSLTPNAALSGHYGLFQYNVETWSTFETGNIYSYRDQVAAIYSDITKFESRYATAISTNAYGIATYGLTFGEYFEIKHELGDNATNWLAVNPATGSQYIQDWESKDQTLGFSITRLVIQ